MNREEVIGALKRFSETTFSDPNKLVRDRDGEVLVSLTLLASMKRTMREAARLLEGRPALLPMPDEFTSALENCARCGKDHERVCWKRLTKRSEIIGLSYTHWGTCPETGEPIFWRQVVPGTEAGLTT